MAKKKKVKTNALRLLEQQKIPYIEHQYQWSEDHAGADEAVEQLGKPANIYKTLVVIGNHTGVLVAVVPANSELNLKRIAKVSGNKKVEMLHLRELEATTGYLRGGCSPVGMKKSFPTYIDASAEKLETMIVSAGQRGLQMELAPQDLARVVRATFAEITA